MSGGSKILILGAGGRVGRLLRQAWSLDPDLPEVVFQSRGSGTGIGMVCDPISGGKSEFLAGVIELAPTTIVALWGVTPHSAVPDLSLNSRLALLALEAGQICGARRVVLISTGAIYASTQQTQPYREAVEVASGTAYGNAKHNMERDALQWCEEAEAAKGGIPSLTILRLANVAGADMLADAVRRAVDGPPLCLDHFHQGRGPCRSYLSARTFAATIAALRASEGPADPEILNLADGQTAWDMADLLRALDQAGYGVAWTWRDAPGTALALHSLDVGAMAARFPGVNASVCRSPEALVADWLAACGGRP